MLGKYYGWVKMKKKSEWIYVIFNYIVNNIYELLVVF